MSSVYDVELPHDLCGNFPRLASSLHAKDVVTLSASAEYDGQPKWLTNLLLENSPSSM